MTGNPHLNLFRPYGQPSHENQLTRAALVVMRLIPLAEDTFLRLISTRGINELGRASFDTQRRRLVPDSGGDEEAEMKEVVSVFLSPDEPGSVPEEALVMLEERGQVIDGIVRYGAELLIAIESKLHPGASDDQARQLSPEGISAERVDPVRYVNWAELLERWLVLTETGALNATEAAVMDDFFDFAEEHFSWLLPFKTLARAGEDEGRRARRLRALLEEATGIPAGAGAEVMVMLEDRAESIQRAALHLPDQTLRLLVWPAEKKPQALYVYGDPQRVDHIAALADEDSAFTVEPNPHLTFRWASPGHPEHRFYLRHDQAAPAYLARWTRPDHIEHIRQYDREAVEAELWPWLLVEGYADEDDRQQLEQVLTAAGARPLQMRPGIQIARNWKYEDALALDETPGALAAEVRDALNTMLGALDEQAVDPDARPDNAQVSSEA